MSSRRQKLKGSGAVRKTLSSQEGAQTTRRARNGQNGTEQIVEGAGLRRESQTTKERMARRVLVPRMDKSDQKSAKQPGRLDGPGSERLEGR